MMTQREARQAIRSAKRVWVWVKTTKEDGNFFTVTKAQAFRTIDRIHPTEAESGLNVEWMSTTSKETLLIG